MVSFPRLTLAALLALAFAGCDSSTAPVDSPSAATATTTTSTGTGTTTGGTTTTGSTQGAASTADVVSKVEAFKVTLSASQQSTVQVALTMANAQRWSNLPVSAGSRNGLKFGDLSAVQLAAARNVAATALSAAGYATFDAITQADEYLHTSTGNGMWDADLYYIAFLGTPSTTSPWMLQLGGHHYAVNLAYNGSTVTATPNFVGIEPQTFTINGVTYSPLNARRDAMYGMIQSLDAAQLAAAKLSQSFDDVLLGPGQDGKFPAQQQGVLVSSLNAAQQEGVKTAMRAWVDDLPTDDAAVLRADYESDAALAQTYVSWSGATTPTVQGSYVRIDGPRVWIEFVCQNGVAFRTQIHFHTIWRDKLKDYGGAIGSTTGVR